MSELDTLEALTARDVVFRSNNAASIKTSPELVAAARSFRAAIAGWRHEFVDTWQIGPGTAQAMLDLHQRRVDGRELNRLCCNRRHLNGGLAPDYRSYVDVHPVIGS
jgi:hypothetical protein